MSSMSSHAAPSSSSTHCPGQTYDVFISHAGPDKDTMAKPLHEKLEKLGISAFVDEKEMSPGREAPSTMIEAMETTAVGVFILSADFVARKWPVKELYCFLERVERAASQRREKPVLIPVFYRLKTVQCHCIELLLDLHEGGRSPFITGRFIQRQRKGEPEADLDKLQAAFTSLVSYMGIENVDNVTNDDSDAMTEKRRKLVDKVVNGVEKALKEKDEAKGISAHASHAAVDVAVETTDSFQARFDVPVPLPNIVLNWDCDSDGESMTMEGMLKKEIMDSTHDRDPSVVAAVDAPATPRAPIGVCGHGGVGKTSALIGVGREEDVQRHFKDGVYFVTVGGDATDGSMMGALALLVQDCGGVKTCRQISNSKSLEGAVQVAAGYFRGKRALFMFDDMWPTEKSAVGYLKEIRQLVVTCPQSRVLISTRSSSIAKAGKRQVVFEPRDAEGRVAREMLCRSAEIETEEMLEYEEELGTVLRFCKGLPLTLQVAGCAIRELKDDGLPLPDAIESYVEDLQAGISRPATESGEEYPSFEDTVRVSLRMADKWYQREGVHGGASGRSVSELYERLSVLGRQMHAPRSMLKVLWALGTDRETETVLKKLRDLNLVKRRKKGDEVGAEVHDLLLEFCEHAAGGKVKDYHADVLSGYYMLRGEGGIRSDERRSETGSGGSTDVDAGGRSWWEDGWSRGYIRENVCRHLAGAGRCEELAMLLTDARWAVAQVRRKRLLGWMGDFDELFRAIQKRETDEAEELDLKNARKGLELVRDGVRESWGYVTRNAREFGWQMYARLADQGQRGWAVRRLLESVSCHAEKPWLRAKSRCFPVPGGKCFSIPCETPATAVALLGDKAVIGAGREVLIVNLETGEREKTLGEHGVAERVARGVGMHTGTVACVAVSGDGRRIVSGSWDETLRVWDVWSGMCVGEPLLGHEGEVTCVAVSEDGLRIVSGSWDNTVRVWDSESGEFAGRPLRDHTGRPSCVAVSRDGQRIVSGSADGTLRVWDAGSGTCVGGPLCGHTRRVSCVVLSVDEKHIVSGSFDKTVRVWDARSGMCVGPPLLGHEGEVTCVAVSEDGLRIVSGCGRGTVRVWDARSGEGAGEPLYRHDAGVTFVAVSADGLRIVSGSNDKTLKVWYARSGEGVVEPLRGHKRVAGCVAVSRDGRRMVSGSDDGTLRVWDAGSGQFVGAPLLGHTDGVRCVEMSRDGRRIVSGSWDGTLRVWDAESGNCVVGPLRGHTDRVSCVAVSEDGRRIVSGSKDRTVRVWDVESGECVGEPWRGHSGQLTCVAVSGDGQRVVSWDNHGESRIWDLKSGRPVGPAQQQDATIWRAITIGTTVLGYTKFGEEGVKWEIDETAGLVKVEGEGEDDLLSVWIPPVSWTVEMRYQGRKIMLATVPAGLCYTGWFFDLRVKIFAGGFGDGKVLCSELVL